MDEKIGNLKTGWAFKDDPIPGTQDMDLLLRECEEYLSSRGFTKRESTSSIVHFISPEIEMALSYRLQLQISIWEGYCQVDWIKIDKQGYVMPNKTVIWGWRTHSVDDIKLLFNNQIDLKLVAAMHNDPTELVKLINPVERSVATDAK